MSHNMRWVQHLRGDDHLICTLPMHLDEWLAGLEQDLARRLGVAPGPATTTSQYAGAVVSDDPAREPPSVATVLTVSDAANIAAIVERGG